MDSKQIEQLQNLRDMLEELTATTSASEFKGLLEDYSADIKDDPSLLSEDARGLINEASDMVGSGNSYGLGGIVDLLKGLLGTVLDLVGGLLDGLLGGLPLPVPDLPVPGLPVPGGPGGAVPGLPLPVPALPVPDLPVPDLPVPVPDLPVPALPVG